MSRRHVLLLLQHAASDGRILNLCSSLLRHGYSCVVIAYGSPADQKTLSEKGIYSELMDGDASAPLWRRWRSFIKFAKQKLSGIEAEVVWAEDVFVMPAAIPYARERHLPVVYDCREIYTLLPHVEPSTWKKFAIKFLERWALQYVRLLIVTGERDIVELKHIHPDLPACIVVENRPPSSWLDTNQQAVENDMREQLTLGKKDTILLYQGGLFQGRGILKCIEVTAALENTHLLLVGEGPFGTAAAKHAKMLGVQERVHFVGRVPYTELGTYTNLADVGMCLIEPVSRSYELAKPNKMFEYAALGIPGIYTDLPAMRDVVEKHNIGELVATDATTSDLVEAIQKALQQSTVQHKPREHEQHFLWEGQEQLLIQALIDL